MLVKQVAAGEKYYTWMGEKEDENWYADCRDQAKNRPNGGKKWELSDEWKAGHTTTEVGRLLIRSWLPGLWQPPAASGVSTLLWGAPSGRQGCKRLPPSPDAGKE